MSRGKSSEEVRLLLLGITGSGKSMTGNTIFGEDLFQASADFASVTTDCVLKTSNRDGQTISIMDSPGLFDTTKTNEEVSIIIIRSVASMHPGPNAILYVVKVGRYTDEEYKTYTRLKALFDPSITRYMIVLFTGGDNLQRSGKSIESLLPSLPENLKTVLTECSNRYILFNNVTTDPRPQVERLLDMVRQLNRENSVPYACPKYNEIGESMETEVAKRLEKVIKKELEQQKFVQQLQKQTEETQQSLRKAKEDMQRKEEEQKRHMEQLAREQETKTKLLKQQMEQQKLSDEKRLQEEKALRASQQEELEKEKKKTELQRKEDQKKLQEIKEKHQKQEEERKKIERELQEEKQRQYQREMDKLKNEISQMSDKEIAQKSKRSCSIL